MMQRLKIAYWDIPDYLHPWSGSVWVQAQIWGSRRAELSTLFQEALLHSASNQLELSLDCHKVARISWQHTTLETIGKNVFVYICSVQSENICNLEIALCILRIPRLDSNLEIAHYTVDSGVLARQVFKQSWLDSQSQCSASNQSDVERFACVFVDV